ncbi:MAG: ribosome maturation factor RimM [Rikenellaceae bacterium]
MKKSANILLPVAKVLKPFGTKGELIIRYSPEAQEDIDKKKPVFIYYDGLPVPFFVESIQDRATNQALVKLEGIYSESLAGEIVGELIYIEKKTKKSKSKNFSPEDLIGYSIIDLDGTPLGIVIEFYDYPNNPCLGVKKLNEDNQEQLLPLNEEFIVDLDNETQILKVSLAKGLFDL